jgi:uncharacterized protein YuzE
MPGLVPGIHVFMLLAKSWMAGTSPAMTDSKAMRMRVDHTADALYLNLTDRPIKDSAKVADGIVVDYDGEGRIVGIEILGAPQSAPQTRPHSSSSASRRFSA